MKTHFQVPAREMLFGGLIPCMVFPALAFEGIAVDLSDRQHLIFRAPSVRFYAGPDRATVQLMAEIVTTKLRTEPTPLDPNVAEVMRFWMDDCWLAMADELVDQLTQPLHVL